jgi:hypothetical protein
MRILRPLSRSCLWSVVLLSLAACGQLENDEPSPCEIDNGGCGDPDLFTCIEATDCTSGCTYRWDSDYSELVEGVALIDAGDAYPSKLVVFGDAAVPLIVDEDNHPIIAAARTQGDGRVVVFGHESYLVGSLIVEDTGTLALNALRWAAQNQSPTVALGSSFAGLGTWLDSQGIESTSAHLDDLDDVDVLVLHPSLEISDDELNSVLSYLQSGGGLLLGGQAWYWSYSHEGVAENYPGNKMLAPAGIRFTAHAASAGSSVVLPEPPSEIRHSSRAMQALQSHFDGTREMTVESLELALTSATSAVDFLPLSEQAFFDCARQLSEAVGPVVPTPEEPFVPADRPVEAFSAHVEARFALESPADEVQPHPAAESFPGLPDATAKTVSATLSIDANYQGLPEENWYAGARKAGWRSTGLYAAPGAIITVSIDAEHTDAGLEVSIGSHSDTLWHKEEWYRFPAVVRADVLAQAQTSVASGFGGLIYIRIPVGSALGSIEVNIDGGIPAPWYRHGDTDTASWTEEIRARGVPWAELETPTIVLTVPSQNIRELDDPAAVMTFWDEVMDYSATLASIDPARPRAERIVADRQISAGYLHSGYPVMGQFEHGEMAVDVATLRAEGNWGFFHELGHNHQKGAWLLPGTTETTCNLWSVYLMEQLVGVDLSEGHGALSSESRAERIDAYFQGGPDLSEWSVWTALETYLQLKEAFGWQPFIDVFASYNALSESDIPGSDPQRFQLWATQFSAAVERDLGPFFVTWGFPLTEQTLQETAQWPEWTENPLLVQTL